MNYTTKRIQEHYENDELIAVTMAVCIESGEMGATREVAVSDLAAYLLDKEGTLKDLAIETAAGMSFPEPTPIKEVVEREEIVIAKNDVDKKKIELEAEITNEE